MALPARNLIPSPTTVQEIRWQLLVEAFASEAQGLLEYLEEEYFEDIPDDPRFEQINKLLSLYMVMKRDPNDSHLARFFSELKQPTP